MVENATSNWEIKALGYAGGTERKCYYSRSMGNEALTKIAGTHQGRTCTACDSASRQPCSHTEPVIRCPSRKLALQCLIALPSLFSMSPFIPALGSATCARSTGLQSGCLGLEGPLGPGLGPSSFFGQIQRILASLTRYESRPSTLVLNLLDRTPDFVSASMPVPGALLTDVDFRDDPSRPHG